jgi:DNA polymerase-3 subunit epsilon
MVHRVLIIDTETSGLDDAAQIIEVGAILYSVENQCTLQEVATLLPALKNDAEAVNRIKTAALTEIELTRSVSFALETLFAMSKAADSYVAHNAEFDSRLVFGDSRFLPLASLPWLCTMSDFKWPLAIREQGSLINLALDHGIGVGSAHRALTDCRLIASLFDRMGDLPAMFAVAMRPKALFQALVPFERKDEAKAAGFKWNGTDRTWTRRMAVEDATALPFPVRKVETGI